MDNIFTGRIAGQHHGIYDVLINGEEYSATLSGKLKKSDSMIAVGDYAQVLLDGDTAVITEMQPRTGVIARKTAGRSEAMQVIAANVDIVFICMALDNNYNMRRLERYIAAVGGSGARPVILLTKADIAERACDPAETAQARRAEINAVYPDMQVILCSSLDRRGYDEAAALIGPGITAVFTGSSGVGKSTLINDVTGSAMRTGAVREDSRGRHTTTHRQLIPLKNGGAVIDTPGMRELAIYDGDVEGAFPDIEELAKGCRFSDCTHRKEPGCAVIRALDEGALEEKRYESYLKLKVEKRQRIEKRMVFKR